MSEWTKGPWSIGQGTDRILGVACAWIGSKHTVNWIAQVKTEADADRIVQCVNGFDALVEALRLVDEDVRHHLRSDAIAPALLRPHAIAAVRAALNKRSPEREEGGAWTKFDEVTARVKEIRGWKLGENASDDLRRMHWQANKVCDLFAEFMLASASADLVRNGGLQPIDPTGMLKTFDEFVRDAKL